jgi:ABC-2 type transport system ATP-binding protein
MIEFDNITRRFGNKTAVENLNLAVKPGEVFALLGPNGAGKTTTIKMLVGLLRPDSGKVRIFGKDLTQEPRQAAGHVGYVPDQPFLYDKLSGREFLDFVADMRGLDRETRLQRIARESENFDLGSFIDNLAETYSHGMKQRLVFASAMLHNPAALVIDEPMVGLDPRSVRLVKDLLRQRASDGAIVFMSTHTLTVAE